MGVRALLDRPREIASQMAALERRIAAVEEACTSTTAQWSLAPGRGGYRDREELMAALADLGARRDALDRQLREAQREVDIFLVPFRARYGLRSYAVLRWRCSLRKTWPEIQRGLEEIYGRKVSLRGAEYWYKEAVRQAEEFCYEKASPVQGEVAREA